MASSLSPLKLPFLFLLLLISPFSSARSPAEIAKKEAEKLIKSFNLSPKHPVATLNVDAAISESQVPEGIVEKQFKFPSVAAKPGPSVEEFGHHAGYFTLPHSKAARMFYYFFESRNNKSDPVVIWLSGGPGISSSFALFYENGPFKITNTKNLTLEWNDCGWDQVSNILFIDQPIGTGFSYTTDKSGSDYCRDEECVSNDLYDFLQAFFKQHPELVENEFYITGESYAGHYIPAIAGRINKGNKVKEEIHINLKGMAIGNGLTNPRVQYTAYPDYALSMNLINQSFHDTIQKQVPACVEAVKACESKGGGVCYEAYKTCNEMRNLVNEDNALSNFDIRRHCEVGKSCYDFSAFEILLNDKTVKDALGVGNMNFISYSTDVLAYLIEDQMRDLSQGIPELLEDNVKLLLYEGEYSYFENWLGNYLLADALNWSGQNEFRAAPNVSFVVDGKEAGMLKTHGPLAFLKVHDAGTYVPMDQPKNALQMIKSWMQGKLSL